MVNTQWHHVIFQKQTVYQNVHVFVETFMTNGGGICSSGGVAWDRDSGLHWLMLKHDKL